MSAKTNRSERQHTPARLVLTLFALAAAAAGCSTTQQVKPVNAGSCVLLPSSICAQLTPGASGQAGMRYINPDVRWSQYTKVMVSPVTFWGDQTQQLSDAERQALADYFYQALLQQVGAKFQIVDQPGPGVMRLQVAITGAESATPGLRTISMVIPQARALNTLKYLATGTYAFVGSAQAEAEVTDSVSGNVLAAAMDRRVGGGSVQTAMQWQWGDAQNAMDQWAALIATRLTELQSGKQMS